MKMHSFTNTSALAPQRHAASITAAALKSQTLSRELRASVQERHLSPGLHLARRRALEKHMMSPVVFLRRGKVE